METPEWETSDKDDGYKEYVTCEPDIIVNEVWVNGKSVWKKGETMFNRTFEVPQKAKVKNKRCENCASFMPDERGNYWCRWSPLTIDLQLKSSDLCHQHTINQDLFRDEMPDGEEAR